MGCWVKIALFFIFFIIGAIIDIFVYNVQIISLIFVISFITYFLYWFFLRRRVAKSKVVVPICLLMCLFLGGVTGYVGKFHDAWVSAEVRNIGQKYWKEGYRAGQCPESERRLIHGNLIFIDCNESRFVIVFNKFNFRRDVYNVIEDSFLGERDM